MTEYALIVALVVVGLLILDGLVGITDKVRKASDWLPRILLGIIVFTFSIIFPPLSGWIAHQTGMILLHGAMITGIVLFLIAGGLAIVLLNRHRKPIFQEQLEEDEPQEQVMSPKLGEEPQRGLSEREKRVDTVTITDTMGIEFDGQMPLLETSFDYFEAALAQQSSGNYHAAVEYYRAFLLLEPSGEEAQWAALNICAALKAAGKPQLAASYLNGELRPVISDEWHRAIIENLQSPSGI